MSEPQKRGAEWFAEEAARMQKQKDDGALPTAVTLSIRELVRNFGYMRRTRHIVGEIRKALQDNKLNITPDSFDIAYVDGEVKITLEELDSESTGERSEQPTVRIGSLEAAHKDIVSVKPNCPLHKATMIMQFWNYSQLPVMINHHEVKGVISWRSIGEAHAHMRNPNMAKDCMEKAHIVEETMTLSDAASEIHKHDYVLVRGGRENKITGIVTATDIALEFKQHTHPFLLVGEIEAHLRNMIHGKFTTEYLNEIAKSEKEIFGPDDLTFGDYVELLSRQENWDILGLYFDKKEFIMRLDEIRTIRNNVVHFSVDAPGEKDIEQLEGMVSLLRKRRAHSG